MSKVELKVVDFNAKPYGRYPEDGDGCGQYYREKVLAPALKENEKVHVILDGYNRYGRSFLDEAFGGLIRESGFTADDIKNKLSYSHNLVPSILKVIDERIEAAISDTTN
ncbi:MAG: STAS-like domain-containing protein [Pseudomonadota bacterium]|nr:STAS-like domain-containing protein [Pseudomonadota bacterium]